jgi:hypothetical protein
MFWKISKQKQIVFLKESSGGTRYGIEILQQLKRQRTASLKRDIHLKTAVTAENGGVTAGH